MRTLGQDIRYGARIVKEDNNVYPLIAYRNRTNLTDVRFSSGKRRGFAHEEPIRRSHHR